MPPLNRRRLCAALLAVGAGVLHVGATAAATGADPAALVVVEIRDYQYQPASITMRAGSTVRWVNREKRTTHSVRFTGPLGPQGSESERLFPDDAWERRFDRPGRYPYECGPHPEMKGEVVVTP
jgi:plastocyanin